MTVGPGKHDALCSWIREELGMGQTGAVVLIVIGDGVNGFSCQADFETTMALPDILENVALQLRQDAQKITS
jgi:hypothetical protein